MYRFETVRAVIKGIERYEVHIVFKDENDQDCPVFFTHTFTKSSADTLKLAIVRQTSLKWRWDELPLHIAEFRSPDVIMNGLRTPARK